MSQTVGESASARLFDPRTNSNPSKIDSIVLARKDDNRSLTQRPKSASSFLGKFIHWIFKPNERISRVRDLFQTMTDAMDLSHAKVEHVSNLYVNTSYFNARVIGTHNSRTVLCFLFSWIYVPHINNKMMETYLSGRLTAAEKNIRAATTLPELRKALEQASQLLEKTKSLCQMNSASDPKLCRQSLEDLYKEKSNWLKGAEEEEARVKKEQETKAKAEEEARAKREQEAKAKAKAEEEARVKSEQEAKAKAEEEARAKREQEAKAIADANAPVVVVQQVDVAGPLPPPVSALPSVTDVLLPPIEENPFLMTDFYGATNGFTDLLHGSDVALLWATPGFSAAFTESANANVSYNVSYYVGQLAEILFDRSKALDCPACSLLDVRKRVEEALRSKDLNAETIYRESMSELEQTIQQASQNYLESLQVLERMVVVEQATQNAQPIPQLADIISRKLEIELKSLQLIPILL